MRKDPRSELEVWLDKKDITDNFYVWYSMSIEATSDFMRGWSSGAMSACALLAPSDIKEEFCFLVKIVCIRKWFRQ